MKRLTKMLLAAAVPIISLVPWQTADAAQYTDSAFGYSFIYPDTWQAHPSTTNPGKVILRNFPDDQYLQGGNVPFGGVEININVFPPYPPGWSPDTDEYAEKHALAARTGTIVSETTRASGAPARVKWTRHTASATSNTCIVTVLRLRGRIFDIGMEYQSSDSTGPQYEQAFSDLVASLSLSPGATPSAPPTP